MFPEAKNPLSPLCWRRQSCPPNLGLCTCGASLCVMDTEDGKISMELEVGLVWVAFSAVSPGDPFLPSPCHHFPYWPSANHLSVLGENSGRTPLCCHQPTVAIYSPMTVDMKKRTRQSLKLWLKSYRVSSSPFSPSFDKLSTSAHNCREDPVRSLSSTEQIGRTILSKCSTTEICTQPFHQKPWTVLLQEAD